jgi:hypothetical protein
LIKCIDDSATNQLGLSLVKSAYIDETEKQSARSYASVIITPSLTSIQQQTLVSETNTYLTTHRDLYKSLFLTNYRESKNNNARKHISFQLMYELMEYTLDKMDERQLTDSLETLTIS